MSDPQKGMNIQEVLGSTFETYLTEDDAKVIHSAFSNNPRLLRAIKKVFLPTIQDPEMPVESMAEDFWMGGNSGLEWSQIPAEEAKALIVGREQAIKHIAGGVIRLKAIANTDMPSLEEMSKRNKKNSTK